MSEEHIFPATVELKPPRHTSFWMIAIVGAITVVILGVVWLVEAHMRDLAMMQQYQNKLRAKVEQAIKDDRTDLAKNVAIISVFFARETEYIRGRQDPIETAQSPNSSSGPAPMPISEYYSRIRSLVNNQHADVDKVSIAEYNFILKEVFTVDELYKLELFRSSHRYWDRFCRQELANNE